jgi:hypothetical protein
MDFPFCGEPATALGTLISLTGLLALVLCVCTVQSKKIVIYCNAAGEFSTVL